MDDREEFDQTGLLRSVAKGIAGAVIVIAAITILIMRLGAPGRGWGDAFVIAAFMGPWAGVFFGAVAGVGSFELRRERRAHRSSSHAPVEAAASDRLAA